MRVPVRPSLTDSFPQWKRGGDVSIKLMQILADLRSIPPAAAGLGAGTRVVSPKHVTDDDTSGIVGDGELRLYRILQLLRKSSHNLPGELSLSVCDSLGTTPSKG
jgi:hypothetical protein